MGVFTVLESLESLTSEELVFETMPEAEGSLLALRSLNGRGGIDASRTLHQNTLEEKSDRAGPKSESEK